jgi:hypothetical protein
MQECRNEGALSLGEVRSRVDPGRSGAFRANIAAEGNTEQTVYYVSPYGSNAEGAFVAVPEVGTQILCCRVTGGTSWYYLGTTFAPEPGEVIGPKIKDTANMPLERVDPEMYKARGAPMKYVFKSPQGAGITMSDEYNPEFFNKKTEITSGGAKKIMLTEAPTIDSIILDSGNGSRITLTDDPKNQSMAARSIQVESVGPQKYINTESQTDIVVGKGGRELQLLNNANGYVWGDSAESGNVNIQSKWKDVNVFTQAEQGRIFIEFLNESGSNQQIVIETNGDDSDGITIKTTGNVNIQAGEDINIDASNDINIACGGKFSVDAEDIQMQGNQVNIDPGGGTIQLANRTNTTAPTIPNPQSTYDNTGVTTY